MKAVRVAILLSMHGAFLRHESRLEKVQRGEQSLPRFRRISPAERSH
jgi:hypothetical protein